MCQRRVAAQTSGSWRHSQRSFGPERLAGQGRAAAGQDLLRAQELRELGHLPLRPRVDAVQDRRPERAVGRVARHDARPDAADPDRGHAAVGRGQQLPQSATTSSHHTASASCSTHPGAGARAGGHGGLGHERPVRRHEHGLARRSADVDAEQQFGHAATEPTARRPAGEDGRRVRPPAVTSTEAPTAGPSRPRRARPGEPRAPRGRRPSARRAPGGCSPSCASVEAPLSTTSTQP
jgi:hypothetical protein